MKRNFVIKQSICLLFLLISVASYAAELNATESNAIILPYSDMNNWIVREFKESSIIGGKMKRLYEIGAKDTILGAIPYEPNGTPWGTSNVLAKVGGVTKGSCTVFPERRGNGYCARLETRFEEVKVFGIINIKVLATGTIFTGRIEEPVKDTKDPQSKLIQGIPFKKRIKAIKFDYKVKTGGNRIKATGFSSQKILPGKNNAEVSVILQKRWEDSHGNIYAKRIGTGLLLLSKSTDDWVNGYTLPIVYGNYTKSPHFISAGNLMTKENAIYSLNKRGENLPVVEIGWGTDREEPTHLIIRFTAGNGGPYIGAPGDNLWIDDVLIIP